MTNEQRMAAVNFMMAWIRVAHSLPSKHLFGNELWFGTDFNGIGSG